MVRRPLSPESDGWLSTLDCRCSREASGLSSVGPATTVLADGATVTKSQTVTIAYAGDLPERRLYSDQYVLDVGALFGLTKVAPKTQDDAIRALEGIRDVLNKWTERDGVRTYTEGLLDHRERHEEEIRTILEFASWQPPPSEAPLPSLSSEASGSISDGEPLFPMADLLRSVAQRQPPDLSIPRHGFAGPVAVIYRHLAGRPVAFIEFGFTPKGDVPEPLSTDLWDGLLQRFALPQLGSQDLDYPFIRDHRIEFGPFTILLEPDRMGLLCPPPTRAGKPLCGGQALA